MLRYYYINKAWMLSPLASRVYRISATLSCALFFLWFALHFVSDISGPWRYLIRDVLLVCIVGAAVNLVAMEYFLFGFDKSSEWKKVFWFVVMLFPLLGPALYCFVVYSRSESVNRSASNAPTKINEKDPSKSRPDIF